MDQECILLTKDGQFVLGIGTGDSTDFIRTNDCEIPGIKGFWIGYLPESVSTKRLPVYVEDEKVFEQIKKNWK